MLLLDTCALIYWTLDSSKLSKKITLILSEEKELVISSISLWEIGIKIKRNKLEIPMSLGNYVEKLLKIKNFEIIPVDEKIWLKNVDLNWDHKDPADRTIVATAIIKGCPIITSDKEILKYYQKAFWNEL